MLFPVRGAPETASSSEKKSLRQSADNSDKESSVKAVLFGAFLIALSIAGPAFPASVGRDFIVNQNNRQPIAVAKPAADGKGNTYIFWVENHLTNNGLESFILYRKFDKDGLPAGNPVKLVQTGEVSTTYLAVAMADSGNFALCWVTRNASVYSLQMRRFTKTGAYADPNPLIEKSGSGSPPLPVIDINNLGDCAFVVKYLDSTKISGAIYPASGGAALKLPEGQIWDKYPYIAINDSRNFVYAIGTGPDGIWFRNGVFSPTALTWTEPGGYAAGSDYLQDIFTIGLALYPNGDSRMMWETSPDNIGSMVYSRKFTAAGAVAGAASLVATEPSINFSSLSVELNLARTGYYDISWAPYSKRSMRIYGPTGSSLSAGIPLFPEITAEGFSASDGCFTAIDTAGSVIATSPVNGVVFFQRYSRNGSLDGQELTANMGSSSANPAVAMARGAVKGAVAWEESDSGIVWFQPYLNGRIYDKPAVARVNISGSVAHNPACALRKDRAAVAWQDLRGGETSPSVYIQLYDSLFATSAANRRISDLGASAALPSLAFGSSKLFLAWRDTRSENGTFAQVVGQILTDAGAASAGNFLISGKTGNGNNPAVVSDGKDRFVVVWQTTNSQARTSDIFAKCYTGAGVAIGDTFRINSIGGSATSPAAAMDTAGNLGVAWVQGGNQVRCRVLSPSTKDRAPEFRADTGSALKSGVSLGMNSKGALFIVWKAAEQNGPAVESRLFNADGTQQTAVRNNSDSPLRTTQCMPSVAAGDSTALLVWANSFCLDTGLTDLCGEFSKVKDFSGTPVLDPHHHSAENQAIARPRERMQRFNLLGREVGGAKGSLHTANHPAGVYLIKVSGKSMLEKRMRGK
jgi:hypothetical protein